LPWHHLAQMKRNKARLIAFCAFLMLCSSACRCLLAQDASKTFADFLVNAADVVNIRQPGMPPFKLRAKVIISGDKEHSGEGTFEVLWVSQKQSREELQLPGYSQVKIGGDNKYWVQRNIPYGIYRAFQIDSLLDLPSRARLLPFEKLGKQRKKKEAGASGNCFEIDTTQGKVDRTLCFDPGSGALSTMDDGPGQGSVYLEQTVQITRIEYSDFHDWNGHKYPYSMAGFAGKNLVVSVQVQELAPLGAVDASRFRPPDGAEEWDTCESPTPGALVLHPQPQYPETARRSHRQGVVAIYAVVEPGGVATGLRVVTSASPDLDQAALDGVSRWLYKPSYCNGKPVREFTFVTVIFSLK
jgi:TonB family protein